MRKISYSQLSTYTDCQMKWYLIYKLGYKFSNKHTEFGTIVHNTLETRIVPDEFNYENIREDFKIRSWQDYFGVIFEEVDNILKDYTPLYNEIVLENDNFIGVVDKILKDEDNNHMLIDYKTTARPKTYMDIENDAQLYFYAYLYNKIKGVPLDKIKVGYMNIPKSDVATPKVLKNGTLSKAKSQKTTYNLYYKAIKENKLDVADYKDILEDLKDQELVSFVYTTINIDVLKDLLDDIQLIIKDMSKGYVLPCFGYSCKGCDFKDECKKERKIKNDKMGK